MWSLQVCTDAWHTFTGWWMDGFCFVWAGFVRKFFRVEDEIREEEEEEEEEEKRRKRRRRKKKRGRGGRGGGPGVVELNQ